MTHVTKQFTQEFLEAKAYYVNSEIVTFRSCFITMEHVFRCYDDDKHYKFFVDIHTSTNEWYFEESGSITCTLVERKQIVVDSWYPVEAKKGATEEGVLPV